MRDELFKAIDRDRLSDRLWELVQIPSPTGNERDAAFLFSRLAQEAGALVTLDETQPESPAVIARLKGIRPGKTLQLAGHLDHIPLPHEPPRRTAEEISGRGSADMKCGLAGMLELLDVFARERDFSGELLVTAYGLHEAPYGDSSVLLHLLSRGMKGDAALVFEGPEDRLVLKGKGQAIWDLEIRRRGKVTHELFRHPDDNALLPAALTLLKNMAENPFRERPQDTLLGPESLFVGQIHYGDFYNRMPVTLNAQGTARWNPDRSLREIEEELGTLISIDQLPEGIKAEVKMTLVGESFSVDPEAEIVTAYRSAFRELLGHSPKEEGVMSVLDTSRIVPYGGIPAVPIGYDLSTAHGDVEYIRLDRVMESTILAAAVADNYLR